MPRVLLVDDDIAEISAVKRVLARAGHTTVLATNAADALAAVARALPAAVVLASTCEGGEALRRFAEDDAARALPLVVLGETSAAPEGAAQAARPIDPAQLADLLAAALRTASPPEAVEAAAPPPAASVAARAPAEPAPPRRAARPVPAPSPAPEAASRKAAAEALRARAEELRRGGVTARAPKPRPDPPPETLARADAALAELEAPAAPAEAPGLDLEHDPGLEAILRRAEEAERAHAAERKARARQADRATVEARQRAEAEQIAVEKTARARAAEERVRAEQRARAEAEERARAETEARERAEAERRAAEEESSRRAQEEKARRAKDEARHARDETRRAEEEAARRAKEEARRAQDEARHAEEEARRAEEERERAAQDARRTKEAREKARAERDARQGVEGELERLRRQLDAERRAAEERAQAEERATEERRRQEDDARRRSEAGEEQLRSAIASARAEMEALRERSGAEEEQLRGAIASARTEMEELRRRSDDEARRRAEAEAEVARLAREAERKASEAAAFPAPFEVPVYRPPPAEPVPDPAQESARRRVAALRERPAARAEPAPPEGAAEPRRAALRPPPAELRTGTLAELPAPRLLALAARAELGGRIDFEGAANRSLWFDRGRIVGATSSAPPERVEEIALRLGLVTREQHRLVAAQAAPLAARRAAVVLLERGFLKPTELTGLVRRRTEEVVFGVFGDPGARFRWAAAEAPADESTSLERTALQLAVEGVRRRWLAPEVEAVLGGQATLLAPMATGPSPDELGLSTDERRVVALADGLRTLDELLAASPLDPLSTGQLLAALVLVGALAVRTFQGGRPAAAATAAIDLGRVREKLDQARRADYFDVLGVGRLCTPHEVREAFDRLRSEFDPQRFQGVREEGLETRLDEIQRVLADARDVLANDRLRDEYLRGLVD